MTASLSHNIAILMKILAAALCLLPTLASAADIPGLVVGQASVIDGDTIEIHGQRIRLEGIDAPESNQVCEAKGKRDVACGRDAAWFLADIIGRQTVYCSQTGTDRYRRVLAECEVGGKDIGDAMVRSGHALAYRRYSTRYVMAEDAARAAKAGMWAYDFLPPWEWRALEKGR
ncbi:thermonuclease family protein [Camelimonas lactis]|uniref:Endonuclease YncB(Thermonuclease family) n=1 Tax=Camelimonas lactis TaxID=659006 RepID=A0A4R2GRE8_9HYPH|nr:thermonuclease family protein [Camelimonas lactis]TCO12367.1 endonuclease YncB(thermonuclease family) [Camelimonas lactis]